MFSSASIKKGKKTQIQTYNQEQTRVMGDGQEEWQNKNIDEKMERNHAIKVVFNGHGGDVEAAIFGRIAEAGVKRKVRDNAVTHLTVYASMPDYSARSDLERRQFEESVKRFLERRYGKGNVVDMRWHFDESAPHLHATVVPITADGRLCAKELFKPTKKSMEQWQKDYFAEVAEPLGYDKPDFGHSSEKNYTKETIATREQLERVRSQKAAVETETEEAQAGLESVQGQKRAAEEKGQELKSRAVEGADEAKAARARTRELEAAVERERERADEVAGEAEELGSRVDELERQIERERGRALGLEREVGRVRAHVQRLESLVQVLTAKIAGAAHALEQAAHTVPEAFRRAAKAVETGLMAREGEERERPERRAWKGAQGLDEIMNEIPDEGIGYGNDGSLGQDPNVL